MNEYNNPLSFGTEGNRTYYASYYAFAFDAFDRLYKQFPKGFINWKLFLLQQSHFDDYLLRRVHKLMKHNGLESIRMLDDCHFKVDWSNPEHIEPTVLMLSRLCHASAYTDISIPTIRAAYMAWRGQNLNNYQKQQ